MALELKAGHGDGCPAALDQGGESFYNGGLPENGEFKLFDK